MSKRQPRPKAPSTSAAPPESITVTATQAQNEFGRLLDHTTRDRVVVITRHNAPRAVLLSIDRYNALAGSGAAALGTLASEFDALLDRMQSPTARAGMQQAFDAAPDELGRIAVKAAERRAGDR